MKNTDQLPKVALSTREGRMRAVVRAVMCAECTLPSRARLVVHVMAFLAYGRIPFSWESMCKFSRMRERTTKKYYRAITDGCGVDPFPLISAIVERRRPVSDWYAALEQNGGRRSGQ